MMATDRTPRLKKLILVVLGCYWLALVIGTHLPNPPHAILSLGTSDKWLHLAAYLGLSFLLNLYGSLRRRWTWRQGLAVVALLALFGVLDEVTQIPVGRECDVFDWAADVAGSIGGVALFLVVSPLWRKPAWRPRRD